MIENQERAYRALLSLVAHGRKDPESFTQSSVGVFLGLRTERIDVAAFIRQTLPAVGEAVIKAEQPSLLLKGMSMGLMLGSAIDLLAEDEETLSALEAKVSRAGTFAALLKAGASVEMEGGETLTPAQADERIRSMKEDS